LSKAMREGLLQAQAERAVASYAASLTLRLRSV
jgi:hypothetical protein